MYNETASPTNVTHSYSVKVDGSGRIVIPVELRERHHFSPGDEIVLQEIDGYIALKSYEQTLSDVQAYFKSLVEPGVSAVDELLAERRVEAARERRELASDHE
jgi:AbrB family looped-hinge helix DNA binding protein